MNMLLMSGILAGTGGLIGLLIHLLIVVLIMALIWWVITQIPMPAPFGNIVRVVFVVICALILILFLASLL